MNRRTLLKLLPFLPLAVWTLVSSKPQQLHGYSYHGRLWDGQKVEYTECWYEVDGENRIALSQNGVIISDVRSPYNKMPVNYIKGDYTRCL